MKIALRIAGVAGLFALVLFASVRPTAHPGPQPGDPAPAFRLENLAGGSIGLDDVAGRVVVLDFWATWCPPCVEEMPSLDRLHHALSSAGVVVLAVSVDEDTAALRAFVERHALALPVLRDRGGRTAAAAYGVEGYPQTFVIGRDGRILERYDGPARWDTPEALAHFRDLAGRAPTR